MRNVNGEMFVNEQLPNDKMIRSIFRQYFNRLSVLVTQVPADLRSFLLPHYMLYTGFKSDVYIDYSGKVGFEILRDKASRFSIKIKRTEKDIEEEIFGISGANVAFLISGRYCAFKRIVFTNKNFTERCRNQLPKSATIFVLSNDMIPVKVKKEGEVKLVDLEIYWFNRKRHVKHIPFAWIFGDISILMGIDPQLHAESDFYFALFNSLYEVVTNGYLKLPDKNKKYEAFKMYMSLITKIEEDVRHTIYITEADEQVFQNLLNKYKFFLWPGAVNIESQPELQDEKLKVKRKADFCIHTKEGKKIYVEIEPPAYKPFIGNKKSSRLVGALNQVSDWKKILGANNDVQYMIIIGLLEDLSEEENNALKAFNEKQDDLIVVTWDYILENIEKVKREISKHFSESVR